MSIIDIDACNRALGDAGTRSTIADINEQTPEAANCRLYYESTLQQLFRAAHWAFARGFVAPALLKALPGTPENPGPYTVWSPDYPPPNWLYSYAYPEDCVAVRYLLPNYDRTAAEAAVPIFPGQAYAQPAYFRPLKFAVVSDTDSTGNRVRAICSNQPQVLLCYTKYLTTPALWDPDFAAAFSAALAARLSMPLRGDPDLKINLLKISNSIILDARVRDGNEGITEYTAIPDWIQTRGLMPFDWDTGVVFDYGPLFS